MLEHVVSGRYLRLFDVDKDGDLDMLVYVFSPSFSGLSVAQNLGTPAVPDFAFPQVVDPLGLGVWSRHFSPALGDLDGDGDYDFLFRGLPDDMQLGPFYYLENQGTAARPLFAAPVERPFGIPDIEVVSPRLLDLDADDDLDLLFLGGWCENVGDAFSPQFSDPLPLDTFFSRRRVIWTGTVTSIT